MSTRPKTTTRRKRTTKKEQEQVADTQVVETTETTETEDVVETTETEDVVETTETVEANKTEELVEPTEVTEATESTETAEEETKEEEVEPKRPDPQPSDKLKTLADVEAFLKQPNVSIREKLEVLASDGPVGIKSFVGPLMTFAKEFGPDAVEPAPSVTVGKLYNLYNTILSAVNDPDNTSFKLKMNILGLIFMEFGKHGDAFYLPRLMRYDYLWSWGDNTLKSYQILVTIISELADRSKRPERIKKISFNNEFARNNINISKEKLDRLIQYYTV